MGKPKSAPRFAENQSGATAKNVRVPPRKARLVLDAVRGKYAADALAVLKFVPNNAAREIEKVIRSAVANAEGGRPKSEETGRLLDPLVTENLKLVRCFINEGPRIKRVHPRAQGRAYRILHRMCHISVVLEEAAPKPRPQRRQAARRSAGRAAQAVAAAPAAAPAPQADETILKAEAAELNAKLEAEDEAAEAEAAEIIEETAETTETAPAVETDNAETKAD
jgi:large subunit ribosomal protein L22